MSQNEDSSIHISSRLSAQELKELLSWPTDEDEDSEFDEDEDYDEEDQD